MALQAVHPDQLALQNAAATDRGVNPAGLACEVRVEGTDDDAVVGNSTGPVESNEVKAVLSHQSSGLIRREFEDFQVRHTAIRVTGFQ